MGKELEYTFLQTGHIKGQETHEKMVDNVSHQGCANQIHNEMALHIHQDGYNNFKFFE